MQKVSQKYREIMDRPFRNRAYISVGIGVVNQEAQSSATADGDFIYFSNQNIFGNATTKEYATLESNQFKMDGSLLFVPPDDELMQLENCGLVTEDINGSLTIEFERYEDIKGITIEFGNTYPTSFRVTAGDTVKTYSNTSNKFTTTDVLGRVNSIVIEPLTMSGNHNRLRIRSVLMGVGLSFTNEQVKKADSSESVSSITEDLPSNEFNVTVLDMENLFCVDDTSSFINYLEEMQTVTASYGLEMDDGSIEWVKIGTYYMDSWSATTTEMSFKATDRLSHMNDEYDGASASNTNAYVVAENILTDAGLQADEYEIDEYLRDVTITAPIPSGTHKECLQVLANACRCIIRQNTDGRIVIVANFANVIDPDDIEKTVTSATSWSNADNIMESDNVEYATMSDFSLSGEMYYLPTDSNYLQTAYTSSVIADENGLFSNNPTITLVLPAATIYYGVNVKFGGKTPKELIISTFKNDDAVETVTFDDLSPVSYLSYEFSSFDTMVIQVTETEPHSRVLIEQVAFGDLTDYVMTKDKMTKTPVGYRESKVKNLYVKIYSYNADGSVIDDDVYYTVEVNDVGTDKKLENPLITTSTMAERVGVWIGNYYKNNISYDIDYRGDPRIQAADLITLETTNNNNLQCEVHEQKLSFNGAFSGSLALRRALRMME